MTRKTTSFFRLGQALLSLVALASSSNAATNCTACGTFQYAQDPNGLWWNTYDEFDFTTMGFQTLNTTWVLMSASVNRSTGVERDFQTGNVAIDAAGLHLTVQPANATKNNSVPCGGVFHKSKDFGFGYYNFEAQLSPTLGTVRAMYVYWNDSNEVDIESPNNNNLVDYSVKPQAFNADGSPSDLTFSNIDTSFDLSAALHNYTFTWLPDHVDFSVDGQYTSTISTNIPQLPGTISLSHWSDGDPAYSGGPPMQNTTYTITRVWAYFNASAPSPCPAACTATTSGKPSSTSKASSSTKSSKSGAVQISLPISGIVATVAGVWMGALVLLAHI